MIDICIENNIKLIDDIEIFIKLNEYAVEGRYGIICDDLDETDNYIKELELLIKFTQKELSKI